MQEQQNEQIENRWQKIGQHGEFLDFDALEWAAAVDKKTKLMWAVNPSKTASFPNPKKAMTWYEAQERANCVNAQGWCGYKDWRLPTRDELRTLITKKGDFSIRICTDIFTDINVGNDGYTVWSTSPMTDVNDGVWFVNFVVGDFYAYHKYLNYYARLVRSS